MKIGFIFALSAVLSCGASIVACSSTGWDGRVYHAGRASFRAGPVPASWERVKVEGAMLAFHDKDTGGSLNVFARCGVDGEDVPLGALTKHLLIGFTERTTVEEKIVPMDGREAMHSVVNAKLDGVPLTLSIYVLKKNGCVYDLVWVAPAERFQAGVQGFEAFVAGFGTAG